jgi:hypothetical protein
MRPRVSLISGLLQGCLEWHTGPVVWRGPSGEATLVVLQEEGRRGYWRALLEATVTDLQVVSDQ